jgi:N-methylhydantoinase B
MDGLSSIGWPANVSGIPVEITENEKPLIFLKKELVTDSGGAGRQRGGLTAELSIHSESAEPITMGVRLDRVQHPAHGFAGGAAGTPASVSVNGNAVHPKKTLHLKLGEVYTVRCSGGGGYGDPMERDPEAVLRDVEGGYISPSAAQDDYGVVLSPDGTSVMIAETEALRERVGGR